MIDDVVKAIRKRTEIIKYAREAPVKKDRNKNPMAAEHVTF